MAFAAAGAQPLLERLIKVQDRIAAILPDATALLSPLATFPAPATTPSGTPGDWLTATAPGSVRLVPGTLTAGPAVATGLNVSLTVGGDIGVDANAQWPYAADGMGADYLAFAAEGNLSANGAFRLPFTYGSLGLSADIGATPQILFYIREIDRTRIFATAVGTAMAMLPDPFDPASVWKAFTHQNLAGMILTLDGHATASVDLSGGAAAAWPEVLAGTASLVVTLALTRKAAFALSLWHDASHPGVINVRLSRNASAENDEGATLGIDIDPGPILSQVQSVLSAALQQIDAVMAGITPFLTPGTWLKTHAATALEAAIDKWIGGTTIGTALKQDVAQLAAPPRQTPVA